MLQSTLPSHVLRRSQIPRKSAWCLQMKLGVNKLLDGKTRLWDSDKRDVFFFKWKMNQWIQLTWLVKQLVNYRINFTYHMFQNTHVMTWLSATSPCSDHHRRMYTKQHFTQNRHKAVTSLSLPLLLDIQNICQHLLINVLSMCYWQNSNTITLWFAFIHTNYYWLLKQTAPLTTTR